jgi:hypothetical protein
MRWVMSGVRQTKQMMRRVGLEVLRNALPQPTKGMLKPFKAKPWGWRLGVRVWLEPCNPQSTFKTRWAALGPH